MAITGYNVRRHGRMVIVTATSGLAGAVYYHWYLDGIYMGMSTNGRWTVYLDVDEQARIVCQDTNDADYDPIANATDGYPARRTLEWYKSVDTDVSHYRVEQNEDAGGWTELGTVAHEATRWQYTYLTRRLTDLASYQWRVIPVDLAGNDGTALTIATEKVVRTPDAPNYTVTYDDVTDEMTFAEA